MKDKSKSKPKLNVIGNRYGMLVVLDDVAQAGYGKPRLLKVKCDCGKIKNIRKSRVTCGEQISCGCMHGLGNLKHDKSNTRVYNTWKAMKRRCNNKKDSCYYLYGGRGITVCDRWNNSFKSFYDDMGEPPKNYSIDRIDNEKGYYKENCRWASASTQSKNQRLRKDSKTGVKGVTLHKCGKYRVSYCKKYHGLYLDFFEAVCKRKSIEIKSGPKAAKF